jgi:arylsulfatase A-like enzyme
MATSSRKLAALAGLLAAVGLAGAWLLAGRAPGDGHPATAPAAPAADGPVPVIIYLIDTLRADRTSLHGYGKARTPTLDALARESVVFEQAHSAAPWTVPSLASILTSRPVCEHGVIGSTSQLAPSVTTLAERLGARGYSTAAWYQNLYAGPTTGLDRGYALSTFREKLATLDTDAAGFLGGTQGQPYLLYLHSMEPHGAYAARGQYLRDSGFVSVDDRQRYKAHWVAYKMFYYNDTLAERPRGTTDATDGIRQAIGNLEAMRDTISRLYDGAVAFADDELGQTIAVLKKTGQWDRALFILMADHGEEFGEHGLWFHDQSVYEELTHVPLLIHFPDGAGGGRRIATRVSLLDVVPTILDYLGGDDACEGCRGQSLLPLLTPGAEGDYVPVEAPSMRYNTTSDFRPLKKRIGDINVVLRDGQVKAIWNAEPDYVEIYDLTSDPGEQADLAPSQQRRAREFAARASEWLAGCRLPPDVPPPKELDDKTRELLRAHGYFN